MLVLSRRPGERFLILNGSIVVEILRVTGDRVRVGIQADQSVDVLREELWFRQQAEQEKIKEISKVH